MNKIVPEHKFCSFEIDRTNFGTFVLNKSQICSGIKRNLFGFFSSLKPLILSRLAQVGLSARRLIEVLRNFLYKMVLSNNRATES